MCGSTKLCATVLIGPHGIPSQVTLRRILSDHRFDNIAAACQTWFEKLITDWIRAGIKKTGIRKIACAGGDFMNVKTNKLILEMFSEEKKNEEFTESKINDLDKDQRAVFETLEREKPDAIIDAAAKVGGILSNSTYPYEFLMDNMLIQNNLIKAAHELDIPKFIFLLAIYFQYWINYSFIK